MKPWTKAWKLDPPTNTVRAKLNILFGDGGGGTPIGQCIPGTNIRVRRGKLNNSKRSV